MKITKIEKIVYTLNENGAWNPLLRYPRNSKCPCGSKLKFKSCCLTKLPRAIELKQALAINKIMSSGEFFMDWEKNLIYNK